MNLTVRLLALLPVLFLLVGFAPLSAQTDTATPATTTPAAPTDPNAAPAGSTVITSDELHSDNNTHISVFTGDVVVTGTNFVMTCEEMTVYFTKDNKIDNIIATGNVIINQPGRVTHAGKAHYFRDEDKFILTEEPVIVDNKQTVKAPRITIWRTKQTMLTDGGRSTVILPPGSGADSKTSSTPGAPAPSTNSQ